MLRILGDNSWLNLISAKLKADDNDICRVDLLFSSSMAAVFACAFILSK